MTEESKKSGFSLCIWSFFLGGCFFSLFNKLRRDKKDIDKKDRKYCQLFDNWMILLEKGNCIVEYFEKNHIKVIAVYGYGNIGRHLITQLSETDVTVKYIIDKREGITVEGIDRYLLNDDYPEVDAIIITPILEYGQIEKELKNRVLGRIISVEDIIYELL